MTDPEITVRKVSYLVPVVVLGTDEQGRTLVPCPNCRDAAHVAEDGRVVCPVCDAITSLLAKALADYERATKETT